MGIADEPCEEFLSGEDGIRPGPMDDAGQLAANGRGKNP
jgi:hypothetical protein